MTIRSTIGLYPLVLLARHLILAAVIGVVGVAAFLPEAQARGGSAAELIVPLAMVSGVITLPLWLVSVCVFAIAVRRMRMLQARFGIESALVDNEWRHQLPVAIGIQRVSEIRTCLERIGLKDIVECESGLRAFVPRHVIDRVSHIVTITRSGDNASVACVSTRTKWFGLPVDGQAMALVVYIVACVQGRPMAMWDEFRGPYDMLLRQLQGKYWRNR